MRGTIMTSARRDWARARGLSGQLPVYNTDITRRPDYGAAVVAAVNLNNQRTIARLQAVLARIRAAKICINGGINHA